MARLRALIHRADPEAVEGWNWRGMPVWSHGGILCTCEACRQVLTPTFARGAALPDPAGLFNTGLPGNTRRAIDLVEGAMIDDAFQALIRTAVALNRTTNKGRSQ